MAYCAPLGIPRSVFLGWARDDQDAALTWSMRQRSACSSCGTRPDEWDPALGGHPAAYTAELGSCRGCTVVAQYRKRKKDGVPDGKFIVLRRQEIE